MTWAPAWLRAAFAASEKEDDALRTHDVALVFGLDWSSIAGMISPACGISDVRAFALTSSETRRAFTCDAVWRPRLKTTQEDVLAEMCPDLSKIFSCCRLCVEMEAIRSPTVPLLKKPANVLTGWELHEHKAWCQAVDRWKLQRRKEVALRHFGHAESGEALVLVKGAVDEDEAELEALHLLARGASSPNQAPSDAVRRALERKFQARAASRRQQLQWLQEDLQGPLLSPEGATRFGG